MLARSELLAVTVAGAFTSGLILALAHSLRIPLARRLGVSENRAGQLTFVVSLALVPAAVGSGLAIDCWGVEWVLVGGSLLAALAVAGLALSQRFPAALAVSVLLGIAGASLGTAASVLMPAALAPDRPVVALNLGSIAFVLGLLVAPVFGELLLDRVGFRRTVGLFALVALAPALAASLTVAEAFPVAAPGAAILLLDDHLLWSAGLALFLYGPLEGVLGAWAPAYLTDLGHSERRAGWLLTSFWVAFIAGRLLAGVVWQRGQLHPGLEAGVLVGLILAAAVALGHLAGTSKGGGTAGSLLLCGLCLGPVFPTIVGLAFERSPLDQRGTLFGLLLACGGLGSVLVVPVLNAYARRATVQRAMRLPALIALLLAAATLVLALLVPSHR